MGFFDFDTGSVISARSSHSRRHSSKKHSSKHRSRSRSSSRNKSHSAPSIAASIFGVGDSDDDRKRGGSSRGASSSFFGIPNASRSSFFGFGGRPSSYYKRSPRGGLLQKTLKQVKRLWRDLVYYAKRHPYKVVALVLMPLITGGFLTALLARFGLRLPPGIERMIGIGAKAASGDSVGLVGEAMRMATSAGLGGGSRGGASGSVNIERGYDDGYQWERRSVERDGGGGGGWADGLISGVAKMFV